VPLSAEQPQSDLLIDELLAAEALDISRTSCNLAGGAPPWPGAPSPAACGGVEAAPRTGQAHKHGKA
jgi:hypothetical protein